MSNYIYIHMKASTEVFALKEKREAKIKHLVVFPFQYSSQTQLLLAIHDSFVHLYIQ